MNLEGTAKVKLDNCLQIDCSNCKERRIMEMFDRLLSYKLYLDSLCAQIR